MARTVLAELVAVFTGDTKGLDKATEGATSSIQAFAKKATVAGAAVAGALGALTLRQIEVVGQNRDMANSLGLSYAALQNMSLVAREAGVEVGALAASLGFMQRNLIEAKDGSDMAQASFNMLGLSVSDLLALSPDQQFAKIAEKISMIEDPAQRTAIAMAIFGRQGRALINIFEDYGSKAADAAAFNDRFNLSLSQVDAQKLDDAGDAMDRVKLAFTGIGNTIAIELAPTLTEISNAFTQSGYAAKGFAALANVAITLVKNNLIALNGVVNLFASAWIKLNMDFNKLLGTITFGQTSRNFKAAAEDAKRALEDLKNQGIISSSTSSQTYSVGGGSAPFLATADAADKASTSVKKLKNDVDDTDDSLENIRNGATNAFSDFVSSVARGENALESLRSMALSVLQDIVNSMFQLSFGGSSGGGLAGTIAQGLFGALGIGQSKGFSATALRGALTPKPFAKGGVIDGASVFPIGGGAGVMGEAGPEAIMPLERGAGGKLGIRASGGGTTVKQDITINTGVSQTVRAEVMRMLPDIQRSTVAAVQNAQNRNILKGAS